jgi:hypothetical protein
VADNPDQEIQLKTFHAIVVNDHEKREDKQKQVPVPLFAAWPSTIKNI